VREVNPGIIYCSINPYYEYLFLSPGFPFRAKTSAAEP